MHVLLFIIPSVPLLYPLLLTLLHARLLRVISINAQYSNTVPGQFVEQDHSGHSEGPDDERGRGRVEVDVLVADRLRLVRRCASHADTHAQQHRRQHRRGRDPQYLTCRGRPVLTTPQYFDKCLVETWICQSVSFTRHKLVLL